MVRLKDWELLFNLTKEAVKARELVLGQHPTAYIVRSLGFPYVFYIYAEGQQLSYAVTRSDAWIKAAMHSFIKEELYVGVSNG